MRPTRLVFVPHAPDAAPAYLLLDEAGEPAGRGEQPVATEAAAGSARVVLVVPGVEVRARWLQLPARNDSQARAAAALLLDGEQALGDEPLHVAVGPLEPDGFRLVAAASEARMQAWLGLARLYGLTPDAMVPDHLLLPEPEDEGPRAVRFGATLAVRGRRTAFACEPELAPVLLEDRIPELTDGEGAVERLLATGAAKLPADLLQGAFAPKTRGRLEPRDWLRPALLAGALLLSPVFLDAAEALRLGLAAEAAERKTAAIAAGVLPKGTVVNDPEAQTEARLRRLELAAGGGPAGLAARLFHALSDIEGAQVESLIVSPDGALRATISHGAYSDMELLRDSLRVAGAGFREEATREEGERIVTDVILGVRP